MLRGDSLVRVVGGDSSVTSRSQSLPFNRISCSQDTTRSSFPASFPSLSPCEDTSLDGGRSQARFQEFVAKTRHMELLELLNDLRNKIHLMDDKLAELIRTGQTPLMLQPESNPAIERIDGLLHNLLEDQSASQAISKNIENINAKLEAHSAKFDALSTQLDALQSTERRLIQANLCSSVHSFYAERNDDGDRSDIDDAIPLAEYMARKNRPAHLSTCPTLGSPGGSNSNCNHSSSTTESDSPMSPAIAWR